MALFPLPKGAHRQGSLTSQADGLGCTGSFALLLLKLKSYNRALRGAQACPNVLGPQLLVPFCWSVYQKAAE